MPTRSSTYTRQGSGRRSCHAAKSTSLAPSPRSRRSITKGRGRRESNGQVGPSQPRVHWLALQSENAKNAFMHPAQWFSADKAFQALDAQGELPEGQRALPAQAAAAKSGQVFSGSIFRTINDPQVFAAPAFYGRLSEPPVAAQHEAQWLDHHALPAAFGEPGPPVDPVRFTGRIGHVDDLVR